MKHLLLIFLLPVFCYGQGDQNDKGDRDGKGGQAIIRVPLDRYGTEESAILHLPDDYARTSTRYPLMVFLHGVGEGGEKPASIYNSASAGGPAYFIAHGKFPASFINPADGKSYKFIVVSPQSSEGWSTSAPQLDYILTWLYQTYRVDLSRVYLTGLSAGGEGIMEYTSKLLWTGTPFNATHKIAAVIPMSAVMNARERLSTATNIINGGVHIWGFGSPTDTHGGNTLELIDWINRLKPDYGLQTSYAGGHCCWGQFYNPSFKQDGMNIYQWALQYSNGSPVPVDSGSVAFPIPGKIEAENYKAMSGIGTQTTTDIGGGRNVGWINQGDWMDYAVNVTAAGIYMVGFRIATPYYHSSFQLRAADGAVLATVSPRPTGGFQKWRTVSAVVDLPAGYQTLRLYSAADPNWNINWMQFTSSGDEEGESVMNSKKLSVDSSAAISQALPAAFTLYPNPVKNEFRLQLNNGYMGNMTVQVIDVFGAVRHIYQFNKNQSSILLNLSSGDLPAGTYFIRVQIGTWSDRKKMIKL